MNDKNIVSKKLEDQIEPIWKAIGSVQVNLTPEEHSCYGSQIEEARHSLCWVLDDLQQARLEQEEEKIAEEAEKKTKRKKPARER